MNTWNHGPVEDYAELNRASWDERAPAHAASRDYAVRRFASDPAHLSDIVRFDLPLLGDVAGLRGVRPGACGLMANPWAQAPAPA